MNGDEHSSKLQTWIPNQAHTHLICDLEESYLIIQSLVFLIYKQNTISQDAIKSK